MSKHDLEEGTPPSMAGYLACLDLPDLEKFTLWMLSGPTIAGPDGAVR